MAQSMKFEIPGKPTGKQRHRSFKVGKFMKQYTPKETAVYENLVKLMFASKKPEDWHKDGYFALRICFCYKIPNSFSKKKGGQAIAGVLMPDKKPDIDNGIKIIMDGLNGSAWNDDKQVIKVDAQKIYTEEDSVAVWIWKINEDEMPF